MDSDEIDAMLDAQGAQEDADVDEEGLEEIDRPEIDFSQWHDDNMVNEHNSKHDNKFKILELQGMEDQLTTTKSLVSEQKWILQKGICQINCTMQEQ